MKDLNNFEIMTINGGQEAPVVSSDPNVQNGYGIGWHIGHAIGNTIQQIGEILDTVNPFNWFD